MNLDKNAYDRFSSREDVEWIEKAYELGFQARSAKIFKIKNPFDRNLVEGKFLHDSWQAGWADADMDIMSDEREKKQ